MPLFCLGMEYHPDEYPSRFCPEPKRSSWWDWIWAVVAGILIGIFGAGCDFQAAQATHESVMDAVAKKEELPPTGRFSSPMGGTWIEQSGNDGYGNQMKPFRRYTTSADLTTRKK